MTGVPYVVGSPPSSVPQSSVNYLAGRLLASLQTQNARTRIVRSLLRVPKPPDAMAEKKSAAPNHPPYAALIREAVLALKVASGFFAPPTGSRCVSKVMLDLVWMLFWTQSGAACLEKRCRLADDVELRAGAEWLVLASHHKVRGREASSLARTLEEGALQPCTEA